MSPLYELIFAETYLLSLGRMSACLKVRKIQLATSAYRCAQCLLSISFIVFSRAAGVLLTPPDAVRFWPAAHWTDQVAGWHPKEESLVERRLAPSKRLTEVLQSHFAAADVLVQCDPFLAATVWGSLLLIFQVCTISELHEYDLRNSSC